MLLSICVCHVPVCASHAVYQGEEPFVLAMASASDQLESMNKLFLEAQRKVGSMSGSTSSKTPNDSELVQAHTLLNQLELKVTPLRTVRPVSLCSLSLPHAVPLWVPHRFTLGVSLLLRCGHNAHHADSHCVNLR